MSGTTITSKVCIDHFKDALGKKVEGVLKEFIESVGVFNQHELSGNISIVTHFSKGTLMKAEIDYQYGIKFK